MQDGNRLSGQGLQPPETAGALARGVRAAKQGWSSLVAVAVTVGVAFGAVPASMAHAGPHSICGGPHSATTDCRFSTPSGNVRCLWTPSPNRVTCALKGSRRAYRLTPTGPARIVRARVTARGLALPAHQQLEFPMNFACTATTYVMVCGQSYGLGTFTLGKRRS